MSSILFNRGVNTQTGNPLRSEITRMKNRIDELEHKLALVMKAADVETKVAATLAEEARAAEVKALETARASAGAGAGAGSMFSHVGSRGGTAAAVGRR
jgi:hypothetical protein